MTDRTPICDLTPAEFSDRLVALGQPAYRARQILRWVYRRGAVSFDQMTDLPAALRAALAERFALFSSRVAETRTSADETAKLLIELADGHLIETVLIPEADRRTVCVSTSVGCAFRCAFCASGLNGLRRALTAGEMVEQVLHAARGLQPLARPAGPKPKEFRGPVGTSKRRGWEPARPADRAITNLVVMGIGEPLAHLDALTRFLRLITDPQALGLGARRITISTVGLPEAMRALARLGLQVNLAVSLHAPDDDLRERLVPANRGVGIAAVLDAAADYFAATGRRVTYEYCLLRGVNDSDEHARRLARRLRRAPGLVNVIPYNPAPGLPFRAPTPARVRRFAAILEGEGAAVQVRRRRGGRIEAACGQLRADRMKTSNGCDLPASKPGG